MTTALRQWKMPLLVATAAISLSGCVSIGAKAPPFLLTLEADSQPQAGQVRTSEETPAITVLMPIAPQKLRTARIPVQQDATSIAYIAEAQWVESPQRLFQRLLSNMIAARSTRMVLNENQLLTPPGEQLAGELVEFGVDARTNEAIVVYQATLVNSADQLVTQRRFESREPVSGRIAARNSGAALERAANRVAVEVADWIATRPSP